MKRRGHKGEFNSPPTPIPPTKEEEEEEEEKEGTGGFKSAGVHLAAVYRAICAASPSPAMSAVYCAGQHTAPVPTLQWESKG